MAGPRPAWLAVTAGTLAFLGWWLASPARKPAAAGLGQGYIVVANRASGSISAVDPETDRVVGTYALPSGANRPEAMYVVDAGGNRLVVGDRSNDRLVVFDTPDFNVVTTVPAGRGVFHMAAGQEQLWVTNDIDNTSAVFDARTFAPLATVHMPDDLIALGGRPHDVALNPLSGSHAYVTVSAIGPADYVIKFRTDTFVEAGRAEVGKDPHVAFNARTGDVIVTCQGSATLHVIEAESMRQIDEVPLPGAHGALVDRNGFRIYATNLPGGGADGLLAIDAATRRLAAAADLPFPAPHNIAITPDGQKLYVTHAGRKSSAVSVVHLDDRGLPAGRIATMTVGFNPFGIAFVR
jgi:DNA-binding beta-propeller fold protein YncE